MGFEYKNYQNLKRKWIRDSFRREIVWLAERGGGLPDFLNRPEMNDEDRAAVLEEIGANIQRQFAVKTCGCAGNRILRAVYRDYVELEGGIYVCLDTGWVSYRNPTMQSKGGSD